MIMMMIPMYIILVGIVTDVSDVHPRKASLPITITLLGILTDVKYLQWAKAPSSKVE